MALDAAQLANVSASGLITVAATVAATVYQLKADWWRSKWGWNLMGVTVSIGLLGLYTVLVSLVWPAGPVTAILRVVRTVVLVVLAGLLLQRTQLVLDAQRSPPKDR